MQCSLSLREAYHFIAQAGDIIFIFIGRLDNNGDNPFANVGKQLVQYRGIFFGRHSVWSVLEAKIDLEAVAKKTALKCGGPEDSHWNWRCRLILISNISPLFQKNPGQ